MAKLISKYCVCWDYSCFMFQVHFLEKFLEWLAILLGTLWVRLSWMMTGRYVYRYTHRGIPIPYASNLPNKRNHFYSLKDCIRRSYNCLQVPSSQFEVPCHLWRQSYWSIIWYKRDDSRNRTLWWSPWCQSKSGNSCFLSQFLSKTFELLTA